MAGLIEGHQSSKFSFWFSMDLGVCLIEWYQVRRHICWSFTKKQPCIATRSSHQTTVPSHVFNYVVMNQHTCLLMRHRDSSHLCRLHHTTNNVCCKCTCLTGMLGTVALEQQACLFKLHLASVHVCSTCTRPIATGSADIYLTLRIFDYMAQDQRTCLKPSSFFCNSFTRLAGLL